LGEKIIFFSFKNYPIFLGKFRWYKMKNFFLILLSLFMMSCNGQKKETMQKRIQKK